MEFLQERKRGPSPVNISRANQPPNQRPSNILSQYYESSRFGPETAERPKIPSSRPDPSVKVDSHHGEKKHHLENRLDASGAYRPQRTRDSQHTRVDSGVSMPVRQPKPTRQEKPVAPDAEDDSDDLNEPSGDLSEEE